MRRTSTLARIQQAMVAIIAACAVAWLLTQWPRSPGRAIFGAVAIAVSYAFLLALQCVLLWIVSGREPSSRPRAQELLRAWWGEVVLVPQIFFWRQPFGWRDRPDRLSPSASGKRGFVLIHGFVCNRGFWGPWLDRLAAEDRPYVAVNLEPVFGSIDDYAAVVEDAVRRVHEATGQAPVLVCHSMGGLAARAWLRAARAPSRVHRVITIGSPHRGTWLGRFSHTRNGLQMRQDSSWLEQLARDESQVAMPPFTCWYTRCDNIVFPTSNATLPWADNRLVRGPAHVELAFMPQVVDAILELADTG